MSVFIDPLTTPVSVKPREIKPGHYVWRERITGQDGDWYEVTGVRLLRNSPHYRVTVAVPERLRSLLKPVRLYTSRARVEVRYLKEDPR